MTTVKETTPAKKTDDKELKDGQEEIDFFAGGMHAQVVFERAILHHVEHAFVPLLERVDEFDIGKVLVLHEKPHWYRLWGRKELDFSSLPLKRLLVEVYNESLMRIFLF